MSEVSFGAHFIYIETTHQVRAPQSPRWGPPLFIRSEWWVNPTEVIVWISPSGVGIDLCIFISPFRRVNVRHCFRLIKSVNKLIKSRALPWGFWVFCPGTLALLLPDTYLNDTGEHGVWKETNFKKSSASLLVLLIYTRIITSKYIQLCCLLNSPDILFSGLKKLHRDRYVALYRFHSQTALCFTCPWAWDVVTKVLCGSQLLLKR